MCARVMHEWHSLALNLPLPIPSPPPLRSLQLLGLHSMGFSTGFERLHYLFEGSFDGPELSRKFLKVWGVGVVRPGNGLARTWCEECGGATMAAQSPVGLEHTGRVLGIDPPSAISPPGHLAPWPPLLCARISMCG